MKLDEGAMEAWGRAIGEGVEAPVVLALHGPLGAGKSVLARAIGVGAGVTDPMPSPTYNLMFRYAGRAGRSVTHFDLYRLGLPDEVWELGWSDLGGQGEIVLIEWAARAGDFIPPNHWSVELGLVPDAPGLRDVSVRAVGTPPSLPELPIPAAGGAP